ncbi:MAG: methyltransferase domain-containing protein [Anaerolineae bacterium]|nr:methyltransferase domain-containing protein [Anaerolineae bacterium]
MIVLSSYQVKPLLLAREKARSSASTSLDLGLTTSQVALEPDRIAFVSHGGGWLSWADVEAIAGNELACFTVEDNSAVKIQRFSEQLNRFYSLMPTSGAPTLLISGIPMHRIKGTDPHQDTLTKIRAASPDGGPLLDTATGLGYTAIQASRTAAQVVTIELDPEVLAVARLNPWSRSLFDNPRIEQIVGDTLDELPGFADGTFSRIIHDPPTFSLGGELYSAACYRQLFRVLKRGGRLFHYIGDLESRSGHRVMKGAIRRLQEAGFERIVRRPEAFGLLALKGSA